MPICTVLLLSLSVPISQFLTTLSSSSQVKPLTISRVVRWIILPTSTSVDQLLARNIHWDLLLVLPNTEPLPSQLQDLVRDQWAVKAGVPSRLLQDFAAKNQRLLYPLPGDVPRLTGALEDPRVASSTKSLELNPELLDWIRSFGEREGSGAVSMLNLLAFKPGMKEEYLKYGAAFGKTVGSKRGGNAKIVGSVIADEGAKQWDEIALAHYPSVWHFADMLASKDYQEVNHKHRVGSLRDTFILCTTELGLEAERTGESKL